MSKMNDKKLQHCLEELYCCNCNDVCICGMGCCNNTISSICDCCVKPMEQYLRTIIALLTGTTTTQITIFTTNGQDTTVNLAAIQIDSGLLIGTSGTTIVSISICSIAAVIFNQPIPAIDINSIPLLPVPTCVCDECCCCEKPIRERLSAIPPNTLISIGYEPNQIAGVPNQSFQKVGLGIALTTFGGGVTAYSTCKITNIAQSLTPPI